jgi:hypothetical protein
MRGKARICVATVAFGLGINKSDVAGVVHMYLSASPEHYLQEIGRAGRNGNQAQAIALVLRDEAFVRHSLAHTDLISMSQVNGLLSLLTDCISLSFDGLSEQRKQLPINVGLSLQGCTASLDCKAETIETLVSLLEYREKGENLLSVEGTMYDRATLAPKKRPLSDLAEKEDVVRAVMSCAACTEPPAGERAHQPQNEMQSDAAAGRQLVGSPFGSYSFSVAQCANHLGETAEPRHVFAALRRLQDCGEIELQLESNASGSALHVRLSPPQVKSLCESASDEKQHLALEMFNRFSSTIKASSDKVLELNYILNKVAAVSGQELLTKFKSKSLEVFQELIRNYFEAEGKGEMLAAELSDLPNFAELQRQRLSIDISTVLSHLSAIESALPGNKFVQLMKSIDYTVLSATKFLHGLSTARNTPNLCWKHHLFGSFQCNRFDDLMEAVKSVLEA